MQLDHIKKNFKVIWPYLLLSVITLTVYLPSLSLPILDSWDDLWFITEQRNNLLLSWHNVIHYLSSNIMSNYMPVTMYTYMADRTLFNLAPDVMHLHNILWHLAAVLGFFQCLRQLKCDLRWALPVALFFAIHPQRVESVSWLSERKDVVCAAFYFWSAWCYLRNREQGKRSYAAPVLFVLAMGAKPMAISLPFVLMLYEFAQNRSMKWRGYLRRFWPYLLIVIVFIPLTFSESRYLGEPVPLYVRITTMMYNYIFYIVKTFFPYELNPFYGKLIISKTLLYSLVTLYLTGAAAFILLLTRKREFTIFRLMPWLVAYATSALPIIGVFPLGGIDMADRYSYIPSTIILGGICMLLTHAKTANSRRLSITAYVGLLPILLVFAINNWQYQAIWISVDRINERASRPERANIIAMTAYGDSLLQQGQFEKAEALADKIYRSPYAEYDREAIYGFAGYIKGKALYHRGRRDEAIKHLENGAGAIGFFTYNTPRKTILLLGAMADIYFNRGDAAKAEECYDRIIKLSKPESFDHYFFSGLRAICRGDMTEAMKSMEKAVTLQPQNSQANIILQRLRQTKKPVIKD